MEYAKKMVLIPSDTLQRFQHQQQQPTFTDTMSDLDKELSSILNKKNISDSEKWGLYQQVLQRFLHFAGQNRKPLEFEIKGPRNDDKIDERDLGPEGGNEVDPPSNLQFITDVLETVPKTFKLKGNALLQKLAKSKLIDWSEDGTVTIEGKTILGSNIADLLNHVLRNRKTVGRPLGNVEFMRVLGKINVAQELVGNTDVWNVIRNKTFNLSSGTSSDRGQSPSRSPQGAASDGPSSYNLNWESFKFD